MPSRLDTFALTFSAVLAFLGSLALVAWSFPLLSIAYVPVLLIVIRHSCHIV